MTVGEWKKQNPNTGYSKVWAEDAPTFGRKGWMACGDCDDCEIVEIKQAPWGAPELHIKLPTNK